MKRVTVESRKDMMLNQPLNQVIPRLAVPTIISMLVTAVYNMADTYFVARISTEASAAVGVVFDGFARPLTGIRTPRSLPSAGGAARPGCWRRR